MQNLALLLLCVGSFIVTLCGIWMIVLGFQRHWSWGVALLIPQLARVAQIVAPPDSQALVLSGQALQVAGSVVYLCFLVAAWPATKPPFFWSITGVVVIFAFAALVGFGRAPMSPEMETVLRWQGLKNFHVVYIPDSSGTRRFGSQRNQGPAPSPFSLFAPSARRESTVQPPPQPAVFRSRLPPPRVAPGEREPASPGIYYLLERVTATTPRGVQAGLPGEKVTLLERMPGNKLRVTVGNADFVVHSSQVTDDLNAAREAEKHDFVSRGGRL